MSFLLNRQEFLMSQEVEKRLSERLVGGSNLVGLGLFKTKFVDSKAFDL
jgi:hypothetical protein